MTCSSCSSHVEKAVKKLNGVRNVAVNLLQNSMVVDYDETVLNEFDIIHAVEDAGYGAYIAAGTEKKTAAPTSGENNPATRETRDMKQRLIWSIVFLVPLVYIAMGPMIGLPMPSFLSGHENAVAFGMAQLLLTLAIVYLNRHYFINGFKSLVKRAPTMDALIAMGSSAAIVYGIYAIVRIGYGLAVQDFAMVEQYHMDMYFESAGMILTLITVGKYMENRSKGKTSDAISRLIDLTPKTAIVERDKTESEIPIADVMVGDIVIVRPGSSIPVDGTVVEGIAAIDESAITGESIPVEKTIGDSVTGATTNSTGFIKIKTTRIGEETTLAQIIRLVEEAGAGKAPIAKLADRVSAVFVPAVIAIAVMATAVWLLLGYPIDFALSIGIAVLVISCPCALGLATPTAIMVGTGKAAENGILFRNAESIETAHTINTVVLDKTGTVTEGKPSVTGIYPAAGTDEKELTAFAAAVEKMSEHPLAKAVIEKAAAMNISIPAAADFKQTAGRGIQATVDGETVYAGNARMMEEKGADILPFETVADEIAYNGQTPLYFAKDGRFLGIIAVADTIKPTSRRAVAELKKMGLDVVLLTGDNEQTAQAVARLAGIDHVIAGVLPQEKEAEIRKLRAAGKKTAMIGDGINDAPALARADVGIAIGAGTDIAIESADIVLMKSDLMDAVTAVQLSKATIRNIKQNLFWAFFYNVLGIPLAAGLFYPLLTWKLNPIFAAAAMSLSSLFVVTNALRLRFFKPKYTTFESEEPVRTCPIIADEAEIEKEIEKTEGENKMTYVMKIEGMTCNNCKKHVENALNALPGVRAAVDLEAGTAEIETDKTTDEETLAATVTKEGYTVVSVEKK